MTVFRDDGNLCPKHAYCWAPTRRENDLYQSGAADNGINVAQGNSLGIPLPDRIALGTVGDGELYNQENNFPPNDPAEGVVFDGFKN